MSPEQENVKNTVPYNEKVDMFALGLILCELYSIFSTHHERIQTLSELKKLKLVPLDIKENFNDEAEIMIMLVDLDPNNRPSAETLMRHEIFMKCEKENIINDIYKIDQMKHLQLF